MPVFNWRHLVDAMTVIESGTAVNVQYNETDARAVAIHEAGHAAAAHVYVPEVESSRLSIKMRGRASATTSRSRRKSASAPSRAACSAS